MMKRLTKIKAFVRNREAVSFFMQIFVGDVTDTVASQPFPESQESQEAVSLKPAVSSKWPEITFVNY